MTDTLLMMTPIGVPLYSARGLTQELSPVQEAKPQPRRTINGELRWLGISAMQKYASTITCKDVEAPALDGVWPGMVILVNCVQQLPYKTVGGSPQRTPVPGASTKVIGDYTYYYPQIEFMIVDFSQGMDEYAHDYQWKLDLLET